MSGDSMAATALLLATLRQATPLALAALGGLLSERVGVVNIGLEGMMTAGAFAALWAGQVLGAWAGLGAALAAGLALGAFHLALAQRLRMDHIISGVAINVLGLAATTYLLQQLYNRADPPRDARIADPLPIAPFLAAAMLLPLLLHWLYTATRPGLRMLAVGESPESARMAGIDPGRVRAAGVVLSGALAAAAGACLALAVVGRFSDGMVGGRGFIALAAVICGRWRPLPTAGACLVFGFFDSLQFQLQGVAAVPAELLRSMPYLFTILAALWLRPTPPAALGRSEE